MKKLRQFFIGFHTGAKKFGSGITAIVNFLLLSLIYVIGVGFTHLFSRFFKKKFLDMKIFGRRTYWSDTNLDKKNIEDYYRQF